jgi:malate dehydrogenase (oxaloacetate-decarboxylating)(NADP+)
MESGVAKLPISDFDAYDERLQRFVFRSGFIMKPLLQAARDNPMRVIYAEGEDERVLRGIQTVVEEGIAKPILVGRPDVVESRLTRFGLSIRPGKDFHLVDPNNDARYRDYVTTYLEVAGRHGITPSLARTLVRTSATVISALAVRRGDADAMLCGLEGRFNLHRRHIEHIIGMLPGATSLYAMSLMITSRGAFFMTDTHVHENPSAEQIAEMAVMSAAHVRRFGIEPKIALLAHSDFGSHDDRSSRKMREALALVRARAPELEIDGEMQADTALSQATRDLVLPSSRLKGEANVLVMPNLDSANIAFQMAKVVADALPVGPILIGVAQPAHILTPSVSARGIVNMTAIAVAEAQAEQDNVHRLAAQ